ncbi:MAG: MFS transporter [Burkholderiales bacterium]|nr:MFS transporter [Burkholderiales bacterium]
MKAHNKQSQLRAIIASLIGNTLEWFDYTLYAYFATVISALFFPNHGLYVGMLMTFATFTVGLAARPIGGIIFGYIGDKYSRKKMLFITMLLMSIPTLCIGMLPTYDSIGVLAPIILVTLRILQGVALGGEFGASCVYLYESAEQNKRSFYGSLPLTGVGLGLVLSASTVFLIESIFTKEEVYDFAWRIPFFISVFGAIIALYIRSSLLETIDFIEAKLNKSLVQNPIYELFKNYKYSLLKLFAIFLTTQVSFFVVFIFGKSMMIEFLSYSNETAGKFNLLTVVSYTVSTFVSGYISSKINKRSIILFGIIGIFFSAYPFILSLQSGNLYNILFMSMLLGIFIGMTESLLNPLVAEEFPVSIRATGISFCWNFTSIAFGATAPLLSMWAIKNIAGVDSVAWLLMSVCIISISAIFICKIGQKTKI